MSIDHIRNRCQGEHEAIELLVIQVEETNESVVVRITIPNTVPREIVASIAPESILVFSTEDFIPEVSLSPERAKRMLLGGTRLPNRIDPEQTIAFFERQELVLTLLRAE